MITGAGSRCERCGGSMFWEHDSDITLLDELKCLQCGTMPYTKGIVTEEQAARETGRGRHRPMWGRMTL